MRINDADHDLNCERRSTALYPPNLDIGYCLKRGHCPLKVELQDIGSPKVGYWDTAFKGYWFFLIWILDIWSKNGEHFNILKLGLDHPLQGPKTMLRAIENGHQKSSSRVLYWVQWVIEKYPRGTFSWPNIKNSPYSNLIW